MVLGKRQRVAKAPRPVTASESGSESDGDVQAIFQRHFETRFKPLHNARSSQVKVVDIQPETGNDDSSEWSGISMSDVEEKVEIVQCTSSAEPKVELSKEERKAFMTAKPPIPDAESGTKIQPKKSKAESEDDEADNLKNDLALQRLLRESHLLNAPSSLSPTGDNRHKAIDLHLQTVGAKSSILRQEKMPMAHRKGILAKARHLEEKRRKEARENGIILEKEKKSKPAKSKDRDRAIGGPEVGRFKGGTLNLSKRDLADIKGTRDGRTGARKRLQR